MTHRHAQAVGSGGTAAQDPADRRAWLPRRARRAPRSISPSMTDIAAPATSFVRERRMPSEANAVERSLYAQLARRLDPAGGPQSEVEPQPNVWQHLRKKRRIHAQPLVEEHGGGWRLGVWREVDSWYQGMFHHFRVGSQRVAR